MFKCLFCINRFCLALGSLHRLQTCIMLVEWESISVYAQLLLWVDSVYFKYILSAKQPPHYSENSLLLWFMVRGRGPIRFPLKKEQKSKEVRENLFMPGFTRKVHCKCFIVICIGREKKRQRKTEGHKEDVNKGVRWTESIHVSSHMTVQTSDRALIVRRPMVTALSQELDKRWVGSTRLCMHCVCCLLCLFMCKWATVSVHSVLFMCLSVCVCVCVCVCVLP